MIRNPEEQEKVFLVGWSRSRGAGPAAMETGGPDPSSALQELSELASSAGASIVGAIYQRTAGPDPATLIGRGKAAELRANAQDAGAGTVLFDHDLTPTQLRNLERIVGLKVIDRTQLILDIFAGRARTREGKLQVELAQLTYLLPRLAGGGTSLSRLGGGIGTRGPGEQQLEFDRRRIRARIQTLCQALERVRSQRALHRAHRQEQNFLMVALVGYTNAGKSTLFNKLTGAETVSSSRMFATLDPTVRLISLPSRRAPLLSDTVGFIRHLPPHLVTAFRATLEELQTADLLLHVIDASHPRREQQTAAVESQLEALGLRQATRLRIWNKIDRVDPLEIRGASNLWDAAVSARTGEGIQSLRAAIDQALTASDPLVETEFSLPLADGEALAALYRLGTVLSAHFEEGKVVVRARLRASCRDRFWASRLAADQRSRQVVEVQHL
ncbi:MAG: GTPase HflX [Terriglobia bacterium]